MLRVAIFFGGVSVEHEVSTISGLQTLHAADKSKYQMIPVYIAKDGKWYSGDRLKDISNYKDLPALLSSCDEVYLSPIRGTSELRYVKSGLLGRRGSIEIDVCFPVLHGTYGEDGCLQGLFELANIPYVGCNVVSSAVGMDKVVMKEVFRSIGLPVVESTWFHASEYADDKAAIHRSIEEHVGLPCIVKPAVLGSSVGIKVAHTKDELEQAIEFSLQFCTKLLIERYVSNMFEVNCSVLGSDRYQKTSVLERPLTSGEILDFKDKYEREGSGAKGGLQAMVREIPAKIPDALTAEISSMAKKAYRQLDCSGVCRLDFIVEKDSGKAYINELNNIPGSLSFYLWEKTDLPYDRLVDELIEIALANYRRKTQIVYTHETNLFSLHSKGGGAKGGSKSR
ncbi:MAG: D-alanine--D-alanine ligase [Bdellovibrionales bacterium]|nr:D-alanine--D-alanine ligase [Bdellovibrionales bacterium]